MESFCADRVYSIKTYPPSYPPTHHLNKRIRKVTLKIPIPKARRRRPKVRALNRAPRRRRHALPRNQRLLAPLLARPNQLVVHGEVADVADLGPRAVEVGRRGLLVVAVRGDGHAAERRGRGRGGQPHDDVLPVVAVAEPGRGTVLGHVP